MIYTIQKNAETIKVVTEHVAVVYYLAKTNLVVMDNGQKIEVTTDQANEIIELL